MADESGWVIEHGASQSEQTELKPDAYLHETEWGDRDLSFEKARNPQWVNIPLYRRPQAGAAEAVPDAALEALARAYDREDCAQRGESTPWEYEMAEPDETQWREERIACARVGLEAILPFLSAAPLVQPTPAEAAMREILECIVSIYDAHTHDDTGYPDDPMSVISDLWKNNAWELARSALVTRPDAQPDGYDV